MDLEHRVKVLEQELEILKNQVQATLLGIQEQLLSSHYPALRADRVGAPDSFAGAPGEVESEAARQPDREPGPSTDEDTLVLYRPIVKIISTLDLQQEPGLAPDQRVPEEPVVQRVSFKDMADEAPPEDDFYPAAVEELAESPEPVEQAAPEAVELPYEEEPDYQPAPPPPPTRAAQTSLMDHLSAASPETSVESEIDQGTVTAQSAEDNSVAFIVTLPATLRVE